MAWVQSDPSRVASLTPSHAGTGCGARQRKAPTGGWANGMDEEHLLFNNTCVAARMSGSPALQLQLRFYAIAWMHMATTALLNEARYGSGYLGAVTVGDVARRTESAYRSNRPRTMLDLAVHFEKCNR